MAKLAEAKKIAENLVNEMKPWTERLMIAGSIRRGKPEVKDIEIVAMPKYSVSIPKQLKVPAIAKKPVKEDANFLPYRNLPSQWELFGTADNNRDEIPKENGKPQNLLYLWGNRQSIVRWIKPGAGGLVTWEIKPDGKYWRGVIEQSGEQIKLDLFLLNPQNWGVLATVRTGPAKFSEALMSFIKNRTPYRVQNGHLTEEGSGKIIPCQEEEDFFRNAGLRFVPVPERSEENPYGVLRLVNGQSN